MSKKEWLIIAAVVVAGGITTGGLIYKNKSGDSMAGMNYSSMSMTENNSSDYTLDLMSGKTYAVNSPTMLHFAIEKSGKVVKDFDTVHEKKLHLIVIRKDRTNFQHVHPTLDASSGMFMLEGFNFPTDGDYRVYADFTPSDAQKDSMGMKTAVTPYQDVKVGDTAKYTAQDVGGDKLASSANGLDTSIYFAPSDDSPGGTPNTNFYAGQENTIAIQVNKGGKAYTNLQNYLGALGHMVVIGPKLEFIHAHPQSSDVNNQSGLVIFAVNFPEAGKYKMFLQTQADNQVNTTDFTVTVQASQTSNQSSDSSMQGMVHMSH